MDKNYAQYLLEKTREDYNQIASRFSLTRERLWPELLPLVRHIKPNDKVLDLGCGNGRLIEAIKDLPIEYTGLDISDKLISLAQERFENLEKTGQLKIKNYRLLVGNALDLPFENASFDKIFSIAALHQIPSTEYRLQFLKEAKRVLKKDGLLVLTVWNLWQRKFFPSLIKYTLLKLLGKVKLDFKDIFIPWKIGGRGDIRCRRAATSDVAPLVQRYYHAFTKSELKRLLQKAGFEVKEIGFLKRPRGCYNIYVVAVKID
jgi:alkylated DNA repair protein alkB family protein 8